MSGGETGAPPSRLRRNLIAGGVVAGVLGLWHGAPHVMRLLPRSFDFEPLADPPGFRRIAGGATSGGFDPFAGLSAPRPETGPRVDPDALRADLCGALYGAAPGEGVVPVASFSDYYCPFCRVLTGRLAAIEAESGGAVRIAWHEWPLLGETSEMAARAALAAKRQGAYVAFHEALMRGVFVATPAFLANLAGRLGIDAARMLADMDSAETARAIAETRALARLFGFPGTPALIVGRTVVVGEIDDATLRALIDRERADGPIPACVAT
jgi:predicted DsbA family dithiol-disulfide isomerase